jgi:photosystem II stability/assembly factor-like uncharacterized protein
MPYGFQHLAIDPTDDNVVFAATEPAAGAKLFKTTDGGATWSEVFADSDQIQGIDVSASRPSLVVLTTRSDVFKSEQGGKLDSWQPITPPNVAGIRTVRVSPHNKEVYVIGTHNQGIYYTSDGGSTWSNNQIDGFFEQRPLQDSDRTLEAEIATAFNPNERMRRNVWAIVFDPVAHDTFYIAGIQGPRTSVGVAKVTDGGQKWERLPLEGLTHRNVYDLAIDAPGEFLYAGTLGGTYQLALRPES